MAVALPIFPLSSTVRASSVDTEQRLPYNRQCTYPKIPEALTSASPSTPAKKKAKISISDILNRNILKSATHDYFLDFDVGAISVGCSSMLAGTFCFPPLNIEEYNDRVMAVVRCEAQGCAALGEKYWFLQNEDEEESRCGSLQQSIFVGGTCYKCWARPKCLTSCSRCCHVVSHSDPVPEPLDCECVCY
ncbi:uncharacterized protein LOC125190837 isoform X1 [Salvia hispanica]|uniref:uncharacterized protein LOC125190837 isoform X1 n=1 Tax=Salvia hispanica TaxID=49212 RepID=UPI0020098F62|nr:uncharacterized protein LOC125190837 isoform X1 [Salvia hispanica]